MTATALLALGLLTAHGQGLKSVAYKTRPPAKPSAPTISLLGNAYSLGSYNQKTSPMWEFVSGRETVDNWTTLVTLLAPPNAHSREDMDRIAEGITQRYKARGGQILKAQTMRDSSGAPYNYLVAAFEEPDKHRYELNFEKVALAGDTVYVLIYGVRVTDPNDYWTKAKDYLTQRSGPIGQALEHAVLPSISTLPRQEF